MRLTQEQLEKLRTRPQRTKLSLFVFTPRPVMKARLNDNISKGAMTIPYGGVFTGSYTSIEKDMTLLVGSKDGAQDYGRIRIRSGSASSLMVAKNDNIQWVSGSYFTVLRYWDVLPVFPRIIKNPNNETDVIFYKDYDIPHTNQNNILGTFINAGSHRGVFLENGTGTVYYTSTGTLNLANSSMTYDWAFEGGNPTGSTLADPGNVYYTTPGDYVTRLKITAGNGAVDTTYRYISVKNRIGDGANTPVKKWKASTLSGSRDEGGYSIQFTIYDEIEVSEESVIIITSDDWYGGEKISLGGNNENGSSIFFVGYVESGSIKYSWDKSSFEFTASSITSLMKKTTGFSISVESQQAASTWFQLQDMDVRRAIYHYLRWHTTILNTTDVRFRGNDRKIQFFDADRTSLYDAIQNFMTDTLMGSVSSDRQGALYCEVNPVGYDNPTGSFSAVMTITKRDWRDEPNIENRPYGAASYIELGGIAYSGANTGTFSAHLSGAPGDTPGWFGSVETDPGGLAITGQEQLNQLSGNLFYDKKFRYPTISMPNAIALRNIDIAPIEAVQVDIQPEDTVLNERISNLYYVNGMQFSYDSENEILLSSIDMKSIVSGIPGDTIEIPETPDDLDDFEFPEFPLPSYPIDTPIYTVTDPANLDNVLWWIYDKGFYYTTNFSDENPTWARMMTNILPSYGNPVNFEITASGKVFAHFGRYIFRADSLGSPWIKVFDAVPATGNTGVDNPESYPFPRDQVVMAMAVDREKDESVFILGSLIVTIFGTCIVYGYIWNGSTFTRVNNTFILSPSASQRYGIMVKSGDKWILSYYNNSNNATTAWVDESNYTVTNIQTLDGNVSIVLDRSSRSASSAIVKLGTPRYTIDSGITWTPLSGTINAPYSMGLFDIAHSIIDNGYGEIIYGKNGSNVYRYSFNGGSSFSDSPAIFSGSVSAVNHIGDMLYIFGDDAGNIWAVDGIGSLSTGTAMFSKNGNIKYLITGTFTPVISRFY